MNRSLFLLATTALLLPAPAYAGRFYLSTERVFAPGQAAEVQLEANGVTALQVRLYRIAEPRKWFDAQADLHRPHEESAAPRASTLPLLRRGARRGLRELLESSRKLFAREARESIKETLPSLHQSAIEGESGIASESVLPPIAEHQLLEIWSMPLEEAGGWVYDTIVVPAYEPGAYLVEATSGDAVASTVVLITDVALVTKQSSSSLLVWAIDPANGAPRGDVAVTVLERGKPLGDAKTNKDGIARFDLGLVSSPVIYAELGASFTLLDPRFFSANLPEPRVYIYTERPVYRPGQEVFVKGFAREVKDEAYVLPANKGAVKLELVDPSGQVFHQESLSLSDRGSFDAKIQLPDEPPLGTWQAVAELDGIKHAGQFKVLSYVKPEVQLSVRLDKKSFRSGETVEGDIAGSYFFGAPYPGADVKITVTRTRFYIPWWVDADYSWYYSEAEYQNTKREVISEQECKLDKKGECPFSFIAKEDSEDYTYVVEAVTTDPTGKTITGVSDATVTRGAFRLAIEQKSIVVEPGDSQKIEIRAEDYSGKPVSTDVQVLVSARRLAKDGVEETVEVLSKTVKTDAQGIAAIEVKPERGGYYEVEASAKDDRGTDIEAEGFLFASEGSGDLPFAPGEVEIVTDRKSYFSGETALVLILAPASEGDVLFTVEGGALYRAEVLKLKKHAALVRVEIGDKQTPNFFLGAVNVSGAEVFSKTRSVIVPPREKILTVEVAPDKSDAKPGDTINFKVHVTDHKGKGVEGVEVALGVVDEAVYAISPEIAVPLESFFHHRKRNDVRTTDSVSFRFFGSSRGLGETAMRDRRSPFGYGSLKPQVDDDRKTFKDTAGFFPSLITGGDGTASAQVVLPDNLTAWRATARAITTDTRVGMSTAKVRSRKPLVVRVALPNGLVEGDRGKGALLVQNLTGQDGTFAVSLEAEGILTAIKQELAVKHGENARLPFDYQVSARNNVKLVARASGNNESDGVESTLDVYEWSIPRRSVATGRTTQASPSAKHTIKLPDGSSAKEARIEVELMRSSAGALRAALPYLLEFPYGCTEQTMSKFVPALAAKALIDEKQKTELKRIIAGGISRLSELQHEDGGWGWWENDASDPWMTAWVLEGLAEAKAQGEELDLSRVDEAAAALERMLSEGDTPSTTRAFAVYALARNGKRNPAMLEKLWAEINGGELTPSATAYVALAAQASEAKTIAEAASKSLLDSVEKDASLHLAWWCGEGTKCEAGYTEARVASPDRDPVEATALAAIALIENNGDRAVIEDAVAWLAMQFDGESFGTTRKTALVVRALSKHAKDAGAEAATITVKAGDKVLGTQDMGADADGVARFVAQLGDAGNDALEITVEQQGAGSHFHAVSVIAPVRGQALPAVSQGGLTIKRSWHLLDGSAGAYKVGREASKVTPGVAMLVTLEVDAAQAIDHLMIEDPRAAGLSPVERDSGMQIENIDLRPHGTHREHRDKVTAFFMTSVPRGKTKLHYLARAGLSGEYRSLPARAESMYLPATYNAQSSSALLEVK